MSGEGDPRTAYLPLMEPSIDGARRARRAYFDSAMPGAATPRSPSIDGLRRVRRAWWGSATWGVRDSVGEDVGGGGQTGACAIEILDGERRGRMLRGR
jgi:hypothetical protein